jgi:hypothetical protein
MSTEAYDDILKRASELSVAELLRLSEELLQQAGRKNGDATLTIMDLDGLGKEIWQGVDPDEYVAKERDSWGG